MRTYIGIDPGQNGGIAVLAGEEVETFKMPAIYPDIYLLFCELVTTYGSITAILEDVGQGMPGQSSSATAKFARHMGHLEMALLAVGVRTEMVKPQKWQKIFSNTIGNSRGLEKRDWKNRLKAEAQRLFPGQSVTLWSADALLIAEYGRRNQL